MSILDSAIRLRNANRHPAMVKYSAIIQRSVPDAGDAEKLLEILENGWLTEDEIRADTFAVLEVRAHEMPLTVLNQTKAAIANRLRELEGQLAETPKPSHNFRYGGPPTENDRRIDSVVTLQKEIDSLKDAANTNRIQRDMAERKIADVKWRFPRVFGVK